MFMHEYIENYLSFDYLQKKGFKVCEKNESSQKAIFALFYKKKGLGWMKKVFQAKNTVFWYKILFSKKKSFFCYKKLEKKFWIRTRKRLTITSSIYG